jgi:hypothetical protein
MIRLPGAAQVRRKNHGKTIRAVKGVANQKYIAQRIGQDIEHELVVIAIVRDGERRQIRTRCRESIAASTLKIDPTRRSR